MQEYDVIQFAVLPVTGNRIEYIAINQAEGALRIGNDLLNVVADGQLIGNLRPGECMSLNKRYSRWQLTCQNYAKVRIGVGQGEYIAARGVTNVESTYRTLRGIEYEGTVKSGSAAGFNYCGFMNTSADKIILVSSVTASPGATNDFLFSLGVVLSPSFTSDVVMNKHSEVQEAAWIMPVSGLTAAITPTGSELVLSGEHTYYGSIVGARSTIINTAGGPFAIAPGKSFIVRNTVSAGVMTMRASMTALAYGPR